MIKTLLAFLLSAIAFWAVADTFYLQPDQYIAEQFSGKPPKAKVIWLKKPLKQQIESILQHRYQGMRVRYWKKADTTVWILNEIGKEKPITLGVTIKNHQIDNIKVLAFRESRGWEVKYAFFTDQFKKLFLTEEKQLNETIDSISGATLSVRAVEKMVKIALLLDKTIP